MGRTSFRDKIITSGTRTVHERGFATTGLREITATAGVAQGSFTNHFASKDDFGIAVLDHYFGQIREVAVASLEDRARDPLDRLRSYFDRIIIAFEQSGWRYGCLAGNMALETAEHSDALRTRLSGVFTEWAQLFGNTIRQAQAAGEVRADLDADEAGAALLESWHGAILRMKIERTNAPLERFLRFTLPGILGEARRVNAQHSTET